MKTLKRILVVFLGMFVSGIVVSAQTVSNVTATQVGKTIHVSYDLDNTAGVTLFLSTDGGNTYGELHQVSGDVGENVPAGHNTIVWDVLSEREGLKSDDIVFKVKAQGGGDLEFTVNGVTFKMIYVRGGTFTMGCTSEQSGDCYDREKPSHSVTLSDYWIGETEVTQALWQAVMGTTISDQRNKAGGSDWWSRYGEGSSYPIYFVNWEEAVQFCNKLNGLLSSQLPSGYKFALPTEAEWEYAARGGNKRSGYKYAGGSNVDDVAWYDDNSGYETHPVKDKRANELGLYDMSGNVWEWCSDWYGSYSSSSQTDPTGPSVGSERVLRGGSWSIVAGCCRVSFRYGNNPNLRYDNNGYGFRLSLVHLRSV